MTQPFTSDNNLPSTALSAAKGKRDMARLTETLDNKQPALVHPNFDPSQMPLDPARSLDDIPEPARRFNGQLRRLYGQSARFYQPNEDSFSKWQLIASEPFAEHLALLRAAKLMAVPDSFYHNYSEQPLLSSLDNMALLDMADIQGALRHYPNLTRYGFEDTNNPKNLTVTAANEGKSASLRSLTKRYNPDELLNSLYADDWQVVLQPQQFESGEGSLATDIMACSVAAHALQQCSTRKSINHSYSAAQICQHVRSYLLSQVKRTPALRYQYRAIGLFTGHIIVAAYHLGWDMQVRDDGQCYFNISSRSGLLTRYANMPDYHINGWSS